MEGGPEGPVFNFRSSDSHNRCSVEVFCSVRFHFKVKFCVGCVTQQVCSQEQKLSMVILYRVKGTRVWRAAVKYYSRMRRLLGNAHEKALSPNYAVFVFATVIQRFWVSWTLQFSLKCWVEPASCFIFCWVLSSLLLEFISTLWCRWNQSPPASLGHLLSSVLALSQTHTHTHPHTHTHALNTLLCLLPSLPGLAVFQIPLTHFPLSPRQWLEFRRQMRMWKNWLIQRHGIFPF